MSLKINRNDKKYMSMAISLAKDREGLTGVNPSVGCVVVKNNNIISTGITGFGGTPHAETNALQKINKKDLKGSNIYVSLEPCSHYGKTPPCTNIIIKSKIKKVFYGMDDLDSRSKKKSSNILKNNKINVHRNFLIKEAKLLYKSYIHLHKSDFPYVIGKIACSKNFITKSNKKYITNKYSLEVSQLLRYKSHGILISKNTLNSDNPLLNCRLDGLEKFSPVRFIIDKNLSSNLKSKIFKNSKNLKTYIFFNKNKYKMNKFKKYGVKCIYSPLDKDNNINLKYVLKKIKNLKINYLLVEGGKKLTASFLIKNLFNEFYLFKSNKVLNKKNKSSIKSLIKMFDRNFKNTEEINTYLADDKLVRYY